MRIRRSRRWLHMLLLAPLTWLLALLAWPAAASAHPLDVFLQASYITVAPAKITVELDLSPGVLIAPQALREIDPNSDQQISDAESRAYAEAVLRNLALQVDGTPLALRLSSIDMPPYLNLQTGYGLIRIFANATIAAGTTTSHQLVYRNANTPKGVAYQVNAFVDKGTTITLGKPQRDSIQQSLTLDYSIGAALPTNAAGSASLATTAATTASAQTRELLSFVSAPVLSPGMLLLGLALAALLGGLHALTPGHGKTLVAAYLVGSRGTVRDAVVLGATVTLTHTASVLLFGALALLASQLLAASVLAAWLELAAALLVLGLGLRLAWQRLRERGSAGHAHPHALPGSLRPAGLIGLGLAGGALPCPEALAILLVALGIGRLGLGLGLILGFSLGLATVLIALGVLLVRTEGRLRRWAPLGSAWQHWLPLGSALVVSALGAAMLVNVYRRGALPATAVLWLLAALAVFASGYGLALLQQGRKAASEPLPWLPARYQGNFGVSTAPMAAAPLRFDAAGAVAWDRVWTDFCDLALAGGPPHRGTLLEAPGPEQVRRDPAGYARVQQELARGLGMVTGLPTLSDAAAGWIGLRCSDEAMAVWMLRAITVENIAARREGAVVFLPAGPDFVLEREIKNVVTVVAKTFHYWTEHHH